MRAVSLVVRLARLEDAEAWFKLCYLAKDQPLPNDLALQVERFQSSLPDIAAHRFIGWQGNEPVACCTLHSLDNVIRLESFVVVRRFLALYGPEMLKHVVAFAGERGSVLTVEYPEAYSKLFMSAGFKQSTRTRMKLALAGYEAQQVTLPAGVTLRHPLPEDEGTVAELAYRNYRGTVDQDMVSRSRAQAIVMLRDIFGSAYCLFDPESSFLAEDSKKQLIGNVLLGDSGRSDGERIMHLTDISIAPEWRKKGLGKALLVSGLNAAKAKGFGDVILMVTHGNDNALALYRSYGFREYGELIYEAVLRLNKDGEGER